MHLLIPALGALSIFLLALSLIPSENPLALKLSAMGANVSGAELHAKNVGKLERIVANFVPLEQRGRLAQMLIEAGWYRMRPSQLILRVVAGACAGLVLALLLGRWLHFAWYLVVTLQIGVVAACAHIPMSMLHRAVEERKNSVQKALPDFLDMTATTVQAGLSVNAAIAYAVEAAPGTLGDEVREALAEIRLGRPRAEALKAAADRVNQAELTTAVTAINQAEKLGSNIAKVLDELAEDTRNHRVMLVEEHAQKLPVKMVMPMAFFMLPSLLTIIFGSLIANYFVVTR